MAKNLLPINEGNEKPGLSNTELAHLWRIPFSEETDGDKVEIALRERIKELNCLYGISQLAERNFNSLDNILESLVDFLPHSWQYPDVTCSRTDEAG